MNSLFITFIFGVIFSQSLMAQHSTYVLQQRAIMLSQLKYEQNLDLIDLNPEDCKVPVKKQDRIKVLKANIEQLKKNGLLSHCPNSKFIGSRNISKDLKKQKKSVVQMLKLNTGKKGIITEKSELEKNLPVSTSEVTDPVDNTVEPVIENLANEGTSPSNLPILSGYVGAPLAIIPLADETFYYFNSKPYTAHFYSSRDLPAGLSIADDQLGLIFGVPRAAGFFTPQLDVGIWAGYGGKQTIYRGPVKLKIHPSPKFTVLNPSQRFFESQARFSNGSAPLLNVSFPPTNNKGTSNADRWQKIRTLNGIQTGKFYFEAKILDVGAKGVIGIDSRNDAEPSTNEGMNFDLVKDYPYNVSTIKTEYRKLKKGDILMIAFDADQKKSWFGVNGEWISRDYSKRSIPAKGEVPYSTGEQMGSSSLNGVVTKTFETAPGTEYRPYVASTSGTNVTMNFGDQQWAYEPPTGFKGIAFSPSQKEIPNFWDSNSASRYTMRSGTYAEIPSPYNTHFLNLTFHSNAPYAASEGGDAVVAMAPKQSGRWQFELSSIGFAERTSLGLAPSNFDTHGNKRLGTRGTKSIGLRRLDEKATQTGKGVIEVNGEVNYIEAFDETARFTFDCNFDEKTLNIYGNGKHLLETKLPAGISSWVIAATSASAGASLHTLMNGSGQKIEGIMSYPVPGAKPWLFDGSECTNCTVKETLVAEDKPVTCPAMVVNSLGDSLDDPDADVQKCSLPLTSANNMARCSIPPKQYECTANKIGGYLCSWSMDDYPDSETCSRECQSGETIIKKECTMSGWGANL